MDASTRSDLVIIGAGLTGVLAAAVIKSLRQSDPATDRVMAPLSLPLPELLTTISVVRRGGKLTRTYPDNVLLLGLAALAVGTGIGLASGRFRSLLPTTG